MRVAVSVPATIANLGPGFDVLGMAVGIHCIFEATTLEGEGNSGDMGGPACGGGYTGGREDSGPGQASRISIEASGEDASKISLCPGDNLVVRAMNAVAGRAGRSLPPMSITIRNSIPLARGMGSSAAAIVGGLMLANEVLGRPLSGEAMLELACEIEGHPDNVVPAIVGGLAISAVVDGRVVFSRLPVTYGLKVVVAIPDFEVRTQDARRVLPRQVPLGDAVFNLSRLALLVTSFVENRPDRLDIAMQDRLHQPYRQGLVPGLSDVFTGARKAGALGVALAGSGPSVVALVPDVDRAGQVAASMVDAFSLHGISARAKITEVSPRGTHAIAYSDLAMARDLLESRDCGLIFVKGGRVLFESHGTGVKPLLESVLQLRDELRGAACADKIIGRASSLLLRYAGVDSAFARVAGSQALQDLVSAGILADCDTTVNTILNRDRTGPCPFEELTRSVDDPESAVRLLRERLGMWGDERLSCQG
ncbi:MAG TPA: homoserine kinase [Firmicutes bacterium]|nr:homoserine kinase [Bacillota bacterium]